MSMNYSQLKGRIVVRGDYMHVNIPKLMGKIKEAGLTQDAIAKDLSMDRSTFYRKVKRNGLAFSIGEMYAMADKLNLSKAEATEIFLS